MFEPKENIVNAIIRAREQLEEALVELEKIPGAGPGTIASMAHALNNYLTVATGAVELTLARLEDHADAQVREWLEGVLHATELMVPLVSQLMSAASAETKLRFDRVDLPKLVENVCDYYRRIAQRKDIEIVMTSESGIPAVWTDPVAAAAILDNLLSNAVKYSLPGKVIKVEVQGEQDSAVCTVADEGPGLSPEDQASLFQEGARLTPKPTSGEGSTGYGLAVAKELVEKLGGSIWCKTALGEGSRFMFRLPAVTTAEPVSADSEGTNA